MLASIHPLGERARGNRWHLTAGAYVAGSMAGGAVAGTTLAAAGVFLAFLPLSSPLPDRAGLLAVLCLAAAIADMWSLPLPTVHRQVNEDWMGRYRGWVYGAGFGFQLGLGLATVVTTWGVYLWMAAAALSGSAAAGLAIGATFGLVRAVPLVMVAGVEGPASLHRVHRRFQGARGAARAMTAAGLTVAALFSVGGALSWPR